MNKVRIAAKALAGTLTATVLVMGSFAGPAQAAKPGSDTDTAGTSDTSERGVVVQRKKDTGWG